MTVYTSGKFADKSILLIDSDSKKKNDRTWCFWQEGPSTNNPSLKMGLCLLMLIFVRI
jgi:lycopene beta-cyclase